MAACNAFLALLLCTNIVIGFAVYCCCLLLLPSPSQTLCVRVCVCVGCTCKFLVFTFQYCLNYEAIAMISLELICEQYVAQSNDNLH